LWKQTAVRIDGLRRYGAGYTPNLISRPPDCVRADLIENPAINSPFAEPRRHFRFDDNGITDEIAPGRRRSTPFRRDQGVGDN